MADRQEHSRLLDSMIANQFVTRYKKTDHYYRITEPDAEGFQSVVLYGKSKRGVRYAEVTLVPGGADNPELLELVLADTHRELVKHIERVNRG